MNWDTSLLNENAVLVRDQVLSYDDFQYNVIRRQSLVTAETNFTAPLWNLRARRTIRQFNRPSAQQLSNFLHHSARECNNSQTSYGYTSYRPTPSAGARHPIDILVVDAIRGQAFVYDCRNHALDELSCAPEMLIQLRLEAEQFLDVQSGVLMWLVAQPARTLSKYKNGERLVLLDAGACAATLSISAHALGCSYCPLATTGEPLISRMLQSNGEVVGVLGGVFGSIN